MEFHVNVAELLPGILTCHKFFIGIPASLTSTFCQITNIIHPRNSGSICMRSGQPGIYRQLKRGFQVENLVSYRMGPSPSTIPTNVAGNVAEQSDALLILILLDVSNSAPRGA